MPSSGEETSNPRGAPHPATDPTAAPSAPATAFDDEEDDDASASGRGFWRSVWEAIAGSEQDYTRGSLDRSILLLAVPMVLEMSMESVFAVVDIFFVARLGADAVATVGLTEGVLTLVYAVAIGLAMSTTAMVARRIGERDERGAAVAAAQAIWLGLAVSAAVAVVGLFFARDLLRLMGGSPELVAAGWGYPAVMFTTSAAIVLLFLNNAIFRGAGDAAIAMRALWLANIINIVLDPCLIFGLGPFPELGLPGAAVATAIGRGTGVLFQLWVLFSGHGRVKLSAALMRFDPAVTRRLVRLSIGGVFQFLIATASWLGLVRILAVFGSAALAGYTIAIRIIIFAILPSWGLGNAAATLVGQSLGAGKPERAERAVWRSGYYNMLFLTGLGLVFFAFARPLVGLFSDSAEVIAVGAACLRIVSIGYPVYAWGMVMVQAFNGAGDTYTPTWINFGCYWLFQIPLAYTLARSTRLDENGVFIAILTAETLLTAVTILVFRRGRWKLRQV
jgi:putative MATE family efflux protein